MKQIIYLLYKYYTDSVQTKQIAYFSAITVIGVGLYMNLFAIFIFFFHTEPFNLIFHNNIGDSSYNPKLRLIRYLEAIGLFLPFYLGCYMFFPEKNIKSMTMNPQNFKIGKILFFFYYMISIILLVLAIKSKE